jgi:hypothetical protein
MWAGFLTLFLSVSASASVAGVSVNFIGNFIGNFNGASGKAVECRGELRAIEMLDLYEARRFYQLREIPQKHQFRTEVSDAILRLEKLWNPRSETTSTIQDVDVVLKQFYSRMRFIPKGRHFKLINDTRIPIVPRNCRVIQIAVFDRSGRLHVDRHYFNKLDARNKTVLLLHSELTSQRNSFTRGDSEEIRKFLGSLFSNRPPRPRFWDLPATGYYECRSTASKPAFEFYVYPASRSRHLGYVASFKQLGEAPALGRVAAPFEDAKLFYGLQNAKAHVVIKAPLYSQTRRDKRTVIIAKAKATNQISVAVEQPGSSKKIFRSFGTCEFK